MERPTPATRWQRKCWSEEQRVGEPGGASFPAEGPPRGCAERPVQTIVVFLLLFFLLRIQDPGTREDKKLNPVATPGSIKPSLRGTRLPGRAGGTRELSKISCRVSSSQEPRRLCQRLRHQIPADQRKAHGLLNWSRIEFPQVDPQGQTYKES